MKSNKLNINQLNIGDPALPAPVYRYRNMYTCYRAGAVGAGAVGPGAVGPGAVGPGAGAGAGV